MSGVDLPKKPDILLKQGNNYLISIACDIYEDDRISNLHNCVANSKALINVLNEKYTFNKENIIALHNNEVTEDNICKVFESLKKKIKREDSLVIYFAGHGHVNNEMGYWVLSDSKSGSTASYLSAGVLRHLYNTLNNFFTTIIVDAPYSGFYLLETIGLRAKLSKSTGAQWLITANLNGAEVEDGIGGNYSPLTKSLLSILTKNMKDVDVRRLSILLQDNVSQQTSGKQIPDFGNLNGIGFDKHFVFELKPAYKTHDVFISYARADRDRVEGIIELFEKHGVTVWWDSRVPTGKAFDEVIKRNLEMSKAVVVVWSFNSVKSIWVKEEAKLALDDNKLFPVMIEEVDLPFGFSYYHAANLSGWQLNNDEAVLMKVIKDIKSHISTL